MNQPSSSSVPPTPAQSLPIAHEPSAWWNRLRWPRSLPLLVGIILLLVGIKVVVTAMAAVSDVLKPVFVPLLISVAVAYLLSPLVNWLQSLRLKRHLAVLVAMIIGSGVLVLLLTLLIPIGVELSDATTKIPKVAESLKTWVQPRLDTLHNRYPATYDHVVEKVRSHLQNPSELLEPIIQGFGSVFSNLVKLLGTILNLILIPFFVYYILTDTHLLRDHVLDLIPLRNQPMARRLIRQMDGMLSNYVRGQLLVCSAMSALYVIGFWLWGVPHPLTMGVLSGFGHLIPYIGTFTAAVLTLLLTILNEPTAMQIVLVIATYPVVQSTEGFVLTPMILGESLELHPFIVIVGLILAHHLFGILGIIVAIPVLAISRVLLDLMTELYRESDFYRYCPEGLPDPTGADDSDELLPPEPPLSTESNASSPEQT
ncbi:MAG: AI-2E family transporter [Acidobacteria bacterium]|nr:AI-2E family transporter [Acidobacteriota bacterium]